MKKTLIICFLFAGLYSCKKSSSSTISLGTYTEYTPVNGRTQLNFKNGIMIILQPGEQDSFYYAISPGKISLTPAWTNTYPPSVLNFWVIDNNTLKIENLYASIPEDPKTYMIFKK